MTAFTLVIFFYCFCGKKSFWALTQLQQEQSRVKKGFTLFQILVT